MVQMNTLVGGRYQIINNLGKGGFGETFLAKDTHLPSQKIIVLKRLHQLDSGQKVSMDILTNLFKKEAEVLEDLGQHCSQIPTLYAYFVEDQEFYLVQEYIEGKSLADIGIISPAECRRILTSLLKTLQYIHGKKIIHRDIKPDNIIIRDGDREPVLIDFGAVKEAMATIALNSRSMVSSVIVGTQGFMPPEQTTGRTVYGSDLYALGLTMIYSLTGRYPVEFRNNTANGELEWQNYAPSIDRSLQGVLEKATKIDLSQRYSTAQQMYQDLYLSNINTVVAAPGVKNMPVAPTAQKQAVDSPFTSVNPTRVAYSPHSEITNRTATPINPNRTTPVYRQPNNNNLDRHTRDNNNNQSWFSLLFTAILVAVAVSTFFIVKEYIEDTQTQLAIAEQEKIATERRLEQERQRQLEEAEAKRLEAEKMRKEAALAKVRAERERRRQERERQLELERQQQENQATDADGGSSEENSSEENNGNSEENNNSDNPTTMVPRPQEAIRNLEDFYSLISQKKYNQARNYFANPSQLNPSFFNKFTRVTVSDIQVADINDESITVVATNTYYYPDDTTQTEKRNYTLKPIDNNLKIVKSDFIRVIKLKS